MPCFMIHEWTTVAVRCISAALSVTFTTYSTPHTSSRPVHTPHHHGTHKAVPVEIAQDKRQPSSRATKFPLGLTATGGACSWRQSVLLGVCSQDAT
mmetsp:Transcript_30577/g.75246  ORF Transcript_30577/g.75246 Transcript_30577/m.75246 type:complete len:96 (-) Transcript_30577:51-338(-)